MAPRTGPVGLVFLLNGLLFASLAARVPDLRADLDLDNASLGLLLLAVAVGSLVALPSTGALVGRWGTAPVVRSGAVLDGIGLLVTALGCSLLGSTPVTAVGLFVYGAGVGVWDVAMNVEAAEVERRLDRTVMPRFHAGFSLGTVVGALLGVLVVRLDAPMLAHLGLVALVAVPASLAATRGFIPTAPATPGDRSAHARAGGAWLEPRTVLVGLMVLTFAIGEGSANDWLALALVDGHDAEHWMGVAGFATFVLSMTAGRLVGPWVLDRWGRAAALWGCAALVALGATAVVAGDGWVVVGVGCVLWGLGSALGFPVGMSAAADEGARAAARVSVVSTIGYAAFLAGPPLLGALGDRVGTLDALWVVVGLMVPAALLVPAARRPVPVTATVSS